MRTAHPAGPALARALLLGMLAFPLVLSAQAAEPAPPAGVEKVDINTADEAALVVHAVVQRSALGQRGAERAHVGQVASPESTPESQVCSARWGLRILSRLG